ncbi:hypothetical protein HYW60_01200 [Candidatus Kaiserbacteria bacterium]|nr:hypothetical protein [Candidatus Kaiserbacteria bacterium]
MALEDERGKILKFPSRARAFTKPENERKGEVVKFPSREGTSAEREHIDTVARTIIAGDKPHPESTHAMIQALWDDDLVRTLKQYDTDPTSYDANYIYDIAEEYLKRRMADKSA